MNKILHCELTQDNCIMITEEGSRISLLREDLTKLAFALIHFQTQESVDLSPIFQPEFNWLMLPKPKGDRNLFNDSQPCEGCGPTTWKPKHKKMPNPDGSGVIE